MDLRRLPSVRSVRAYHLKDRLRRQFVVRRLTRLPRRPYPGPMIPVVRRKHRFRIQWFVVAPAGSKWFAKAVPAGWVAARYGQGLARGDLPTVDLDYRTG